MDQREKLGKFEYVYNLKMIKIIYVSGATKIELEKDYDPSAYVVFLILNLLF